MNLSLIKYLFLISWLTYICAYGDKLLMPEQTNKQIIGELMLPVLTPIMKDEEERKQEEQDENTKNIIAKIISGTDNDLQNIASNLATDPEKFTKITNKISEILNDYKAPEHKNFMYDDAVYKDNELSKKITIKIINSKIEDVISLINKITPINFVIDHDVSGIIKNLNVSDVPVSQIFKLILKQNDPELTIVKESGIYRIIKLSKAINATIKKENKTNDKFACGIFTFQNQKITESFKLKIDKIWLGVTNGESSKQSYYVISDEISRKVFFRGKKEYVENFKEYLKQIDIKIPQVKIEARIVIANKNFEESFGLQWSNIFNRRAGIKRGISFVGTGPLVDIKNNPQAQSKEDLMDWALNMFPVLGEATRKLHVPFVFGGNDLNTKRLNVILNAAENTNELKTILKPILVTNNSEEAEILVGEQIPLEVVVKEAIEGSLRDITTVNYKDIGIKLKVKPVVSADSSSIFLDIYVENSFRLNTERFPVIEISNSRSRVILKNGQTTLIGGLVRTEKQLQKTDLPLISKIPILKSLFSGARKFREDKQLLIFITPTII